MVIQTLKQRRSPMRQTRRRTSGIRWLHDSAGREFMIPEETK
jgi:hypothetical protein